VRRGRRLTGLFLASFLLAALAGCGAPFFISDQELAVILGKEYLYAGSSVGVDAFEVDGSTGRITKLAGSPFGSGCIGALTSAPSGSFLYAMPYLSNAAYGFGVGRDGALAVLPAFPPAPSLSSPTAMAIDPQQRSAYILQAGTSQSINSYAFDAGTGAVTFLGATLGVGCSPVAAITSSDGRFLYVGRGIPSSILRYPADAGILGAAVTAATVPGAPLRLVRDPGGQYLYAVTSSPSDQNILGYRIDASTGALAPVSGSPFRLGFGPANISATGLAIDDWGVFLYAAGSDDTLYRYRIDGDTGSLSLAQTLGSPNGARLRVSHSGRYVFAGGDDNSGVGVIRVYEVAPDGTLSEVPGSPFPQTGGPVRDLETINSRRLP
jgi:6-phosphogluconolactonase